MAMGGREFTEARAAEARRRFGGPADVFRFGGGILVVVLGALMIADSVVLAVTGTAVFFAGSGGAFEFAVGLVAIILGASQVPQPK